MIETGNYSIRYYNRYGAITRETKHIKKSLTQAIVVGMETVKDNAELASFTVDRRVFNSLDKDTGD